MIYDFNNCFQRNPDVLQDVCEHRVQMCNYILSIQPNVTYEDRKYYESEIRRYKFYDI